MAVKIEYTVAAHNHDILHNASDVYASRSMGPQTEQKQPEYMLLVHRNLLAYTEK